MIEPFTLSLFMTMLFLSKNTPDRLVGVFEEEWQQLTMEEQAKAADWAKRLNVVLRVYPKPERTVDDQLIKEGYHRCPDNMWRRVPSNGMFDGVCNVCEHYIYQEG